jgi:sugar phosphate isomerase/epimerase
MRLGLSSGAAPDATLAELLAACRRRGLAGVELVEGHAHGVSPAGRDAPAAGAPGADDGGPRVLAFRCATETSALSDAAARLSRRLGCPVISPTIPSATLLERTGARYRDEGGTLLLACPSEPGEARRAAELAGRAGPAVALSWDLAPGGVSAHTTGDMLAAAGAALRHVRLFGGGPEAVLLEGRGIGELAVQLALAHYDGPLVLTPSTDSYRQAWRSWLGRRGGWGCGSSRERGTLVTLTKVRDATREGTTP